jgi:nicotinamidase-related amidase
MKTALLIIDVQRGLFDPEPRPFEADQVMRRINQLAAQARTHSVPVVFIQHESREGSLQFGSDGWQLAQELDLEEGDVVLRKTTPDSFLRTELAELLQVWEVEQVVVCGYASEFCVDTTVRRAAAQGLMWCWWKMHTRRMTKPICPPARSVNITTVRCRRSAVSQPYQCAAGSQPAI